MDFRAKKCPQLDITWVKKIFHERDFHKTNLEKGESIIRVIVCINEEAPKANEGPGLKSCYNIFRVLSPLNKYQEGEKGAGTAIEHMNRMFGERGVWTVMTKFHLERILYYLRHEKEALQLRSKLCSHRFMA